MARRKEKTAQEWFDEIERGFNYRRHFGLEDIWADMEAMFYNVKLVDDDSNESLLGPNIVYSVGDSLISNLTVLYPKPLVIPRRQQDVLGSRVLSSIDEYLLSELELVSEIEKVALYSYLWGVGIIKLGYDSEFGFDPTLDLGKIAYGKEIGETLTQFDKSGEYRIELPGTHPGMPWAKAVAPHDIIVPWGTISLETTPWVAHRFIRHIDDIKSDPKYEHTKNLRPQLSLKDYVETYNMVAEAHMVGQELYTDIASDSSEYIQGFEIHDMMRRKVYVVFTGSEKIHRNDVDYMQLDGPPFVALNFVPRSRSFWVTPEAYYLQPHQKELVEIAETASMQRKASLLRFLYNKGAVTDKQMDEYLNGESVLGLGIENQFKLNEAIKELSNHTNIELYRDAESVRQNARETIGMSRNQTGEYTGGRKTASEVRAVEMAAQNRSGRKQVALKRFYSRVFKKLNSIIFNYWKLPRMQEVIGPNGASILVQYTGDQVEGDYGYEVLFSDEPQPTRESRKREAAGLYQTLSQDPSVNQIKLREMLVYRFNDPALADIFNITQFGGMQQNANLSVPMQQMQQEGRNTNARNPEGTTSTPNVPGLPSTNGEIIPEPTGGS